MSTQALKFAGTNLEVDPNLQDLVGTSSEKGTSRSSTRSYHSFEDEVYCLPNDAAEHDRLNLQDHMWSLGLYGGIHISPIQPTVENVLDIGAGTGKWAIDFARAHPECQVLGTDLTPVQAPEDKPDNVNFIVANANQTWDFNGQKFDFIHSRMLVLGVPDWTHYFAQAFHHTKPGGWIEVQEPRFPVESINEGGVTEQSPMSQFTIYSIEATDKLGVSLQASDNFEKILQAQGFINIKVQTLKWAMGPWPKDPRDKEIGRLMITNMGEGLLPLFVSKLYCGVLGWTEAQGAEFEQLVREDMEDPGKHYYMHLVVCSAQKPF